MDQKKIGSFIAEKRKIRGLTQKQLAEALGMSDKSVSKWERGVCLPDVSIYRSLCDILGITLNEFFAGEDIEEKNILRQSEKNLIDVVQTGHKQGFKLKSIIAALLIVLLVIGGSCLWFLNSEGYLIHNYIGLYPENTPEIKMARTLTRDGNVHVFRYDVDKKYTSLKLEMFTYKKGKEVKEAYRETSFGFDGDGGAEGLIAVIPDVENNTVEIVLTTKWSKQVTTFDTENISFFNEGYGNTDITLQENKKIDKGKTCGILALIYSKKNLSATPIEDISSSPNTALKDNDICRYFQVSFD